MVDRWATSGYSLDNADAPGDSSFDGNPTSIFRDIVPQTFTGIDGTTITIDNNAWPPAGPSVPPLFATHGYDMTTGFGSPRADRFVAALAAQSPPTLVSQRARQYAGPFSFLKEANRSELRRPVTIV